MNHCEQIEHKFEPFKNQIIAINNAVEGCSTIGFHGLLQEMSLGKTKCSLNTAEIMAKYGMLKRILILCPKSIIGVWKEEIPKHSNFSFEPVVWNSSRSKTRKFQRRIGEMMTARFPIMIINIEAFQTNNKVLVDLVKSYLDDRAMVILDESSKIKNIRAQRTARILESTSKADYKLILTGTEVEESPLDVFSQFEFLRGGFWYTTPQWDIKKAKKNFWLFKNRYAILKEIRLSEGRSFKQIVGFRRVDEIACKIAPYITRQKKKDWFDLPEKIYQTIPVEMEPKQAKLYKEIKNNLIAEFGETLLTVSNAVSLLTRLRQIAGGFMPESGEQISNSGIQAIIDDVEEYSGKVIISCAFVSEIEGVEKALIKEYGEDQVVTYYGKTKDRETAIKRFREDARFIVGNPTVLGYGLNLQFCSLMYNYSRNFSYAVNAQLSDRIHRPGQKNSCVYKDIIHIGTVQERVLRAIKKKEDFVTSFQNMTIRDLFG